MSPENNRSSPPFEECTFVADASIIRNHIDEICAIETATFDPPWKKGDFINELESNDSHSMVLLNCGMPIGYLFSKMAIDEITINKLCIHAEYRRHGYGRLLLGNFIGRMKGRYSRIFLEVESTNMPAIRLYTGNGFRVNRIRKAIYADGADALEMVLDGE